MTGQQWFSPFQTSSLLLSEEAVWAALVEWAAVVRPFPDQERPVPFQPAGMESLPDQVAACHRHHIHPAT